MSLALFSRPRRRCPCHNLRLRHRGEFALAPVDPVAQDVLTGRAGTIHCWLVPSLLTRNRLLPRWWLRTMRQHWTHKS